jgi:hypothetical protein
MLEVSHSLTLIAIILAKVFSSICPKRMLTVPSRIWTEKNSAVVRSAFPLMNPALVLTITVAMIAVMIGTATERTGMIGIAVTVPGHPPAVVIMKIVVPGLHPRRGIMMIEGL